MIAPLMKNLYAYRRYDIYTVLWNINEVLTFKNVERDGTTGEQGLCKEETKELRIGGTMENQETER